MARLHQLVLALVFLTRLPLARLLPGHPMTLGAGAWAFPLAGALVGALASVPLLLVQPPLLAAGLSLALSVWLTGALHEDALADFADAHGGGDREARLRIMRDSRIGSYGVMALIVTSLLRAAALAVLGPAALIASAAGGRAAIVVAMRVLPPARPDGLGRAAGRPGHGALAAALLIALAALLPAGRDAVPALALGAAAAGLTMRRAQNLINGQSGDVLGTVSVLTETAMLTGFAMTAPAALF
ncbi:adenosylcobinamide-GDP ribazoletransferase [Paracoccus sp. (in: a-proteobacteria)]|nr:adenosylcobinamide-GDP ribazoletransferase [Paracoccus sp. (in: a-proteobacteria)]